MATTAQVFYPSSTDQDQAWGTDVDKLLESVPALLSTTIAQHPNAAGTTDITLDPFTSRSTQGDAATNFGWAFNEAGADGMASVADARRRILAGDWTVRFRIAIPTGGTTIGSHNVTMIVKLYRVATGGGTRTLIATLTSAEEGGSAFGVTTTTIEVTASVAEIILEAGETLHVGIISRNRQAAGLFGATTAGNITWHVGTQGGVTTMVTVTSPGVRTLHGRPLTDTAPATDSEPGRLLQLPRVVEESVPTTEELARQGVFGRLFLEDIFSEAGLDRKYLAYRALVESGATSDVLARMQGLFRRLIEED